MSRHTNLAPKQTAFSIQNFFEGTTYAWGIFEDRFGKVRSRSSVVINGIWLNNTFTLQEEIIYDNERKENRTWHILFENHGKFTATCDDCISQAVGRTLENEILMRYRLNLKIKKRSLKADFLDRIIKIDNRHAVGKTTMFKWGVKLGELLLFFEKS
ncbi:MAG: DUF3833 family protein [Hyphomicrobiaceae bacterium]|nr:DUF3833 family protein [Hyphomicrobiaceae bacterium]